MAVIALTAGAGLIIAQISMAVASPLFSVANGISWLMVHSVDPFVRFGLASFRLPEYSGWFASIYSLYYIPVVILAGSLSRWNPLAQTLPLRRRALGITRAALLTQVIALALVIAHPSGGRADGRLHVSGWDDTPGGRRWPAKVPGESSRWRRRL
jgi:hypothetical protein